MTDFENSDDELYANESFENESDTEVPEMSEFESETSENSEDNDEDDDDDDDDLPSVKLNTGPIKRNSFSNNFTTIHKTDVVPFASSSDEEDDVIVGQTLAEINTPSMHFEDEPPTPAPRHLLPIFKEKTHHLKSVEEEAQVSSEEISEEEDDEEEEFKRIQDMEEKYLQQNSAKTFKEINSEVIKGSVVEKNGVGGTENEQGSEEQETESYDEAEEEQESNHELETETKDEHLEVPLNKEDSEKIYSSEPQNNIPDNTIESMAQNSLMQIIQSSLANLKIASTNDNEDNFLKTTQALLLSETVTHSIDTANIIKPEQITLAVVNALKCTGITNLQSLGKLETQSQELIKVQETEDKKDGAKLAIESNIECGKERELELVQYEDDYEGEEETAAEIEEIQNNNPVGEDNYDDDRDVYYDAHFDYRITSKTPTSFNSDDYIFHANFIKQFHRTNSTDKLRVKPHPRKSMSFSNERMREIERHNQILLRKILTQKPTYTLKSKPSQPSIQKIPSQSNARLTTSAVNRKKQQRQIDLDNQVLKRKIEAISLRRRPLIP
ncbi:protein hemingway [Calliphora vicina]|uniref:protein hemingway n=1 Tax=Calliphora vicina TaxID=7373 RepID=UPI00325A7083